MLVFSFDKRDRLNYTDLQRVLVMKNGYTIGAGLLFLLLALPLAWAGPAGSPGFTLPEAKKDCAMCHLSHVVKQEAALLKMPLQELCIECHPDRKAPAEHKVDISPKMAPEKLPLSQGKMTCITCHDPHKNPYGSLLRMPRKDLCSRCHPQ
jgi:predicted CXXCH cytochrome family protein